MAFDGTQEDFETEAEARILFASKKKMVDNAKIVKDGDMEIIPSCNIHYCYHDEMPIKPCVVIERFEKQENIIRRILGV